MEFTTIKIGGMSCNGCAQSITEVLLALPGVTMAEVSLVTGKADITFAPEQTERPALARAIDDAGFEAS